MNSKKLNPQKSFEPSRDELASTEIQPFSELLKPVAEEALKEAQKNKRNRKGTLFTPIDLFLINYTLYFMGLY